MVDWTFTCCNDQQYLSIILITLYAVLILKLWHVSIIHPFKILTVFLHELGHATACWLTCGVVEGMIITPDEGGQTKTRGGIQWIVLPAGYIGSSVWGMGLVIASADQLASEIASGVLMFFLVVFFFYAENKYFRALNFGFVVLLIALLLLNLLTDADPLQYVLLFVGVMSCLFSIYDIWDDLIARRVNESDATAFAKLTHTSSRCWGAIWGLIAVLSLAAAIYFNLLVGEDEGPEIHSFGDLSKQVTVVFYIAVVLIGIALAHTLITQRCMVRKRSGFSEYFGRLESPA